MNTFFSEDCKNVNRGHIVFQLPTKEGKYVYDKKSKTLTVSFNDGLEDVVLHKVGIQYLFQMYSLIYPQPCKAFVRIIRHLNRRVIPSNRKFGV